jgi:hypothetical protein
MCWPPPSKRAPTAGGHFSTKHARTIQPCAPRPSRYCAHTPLRDTFLEKPLLAGIDVADIGAVSEAEPHVGRMLGPYLIEECIGRGGMGTVYLARRADQEFERRVAIKMIRRGMDSEAVIRRFRHERQILRTGRLILPEERSGSVVLRMSRGLHRCSRTSCSIGCVNRSA